MNKGQVSIEFMALLSIALLGSSILVTELTDRAIQYSKSSPYSEAQKIAQEVSYTFDYLKTQKNASRDLDFDPGLRKDYTITVGNGQTVVSFDSGSASFPTRYKGSSLDLKANQSYVVSYNGSYSVK